MQEWKRTMMTADGTTFQVINGMFQVTFYEQKQDLNTCHLRVTAGRNVNTQSEIHNTGKVVE